MSPTSDDFFDLVTMWMTDIHAIEEEHRAKLQAADAGFLESLHEPTADPARSMADWLAKTATLEAARANARSVCDEEHKARILSLQSKLGHRKEG